MRELIWQYPMVFALSVCIPITIIGIALVIACFSVKNKDIDLD